MLGKKVSSLVTALRWEISILSKIFRVLSPLPVSYTHLDVYKRQDKDGNKELEAGKEVTIIDTVTLEGLEVGTQYKLVGWQMLKEENAELLINGKRVESDYTFTADSETRWV